MGEKMKRNLLIFVFSLLFILSLSTSAFARSYKIGATAEWIAWSPLEVAEARGFWKEQSVEVELAVFPSDNESRDALENNKTDMNMCMLGTAVDLHLKGRPVKIIMEADWSNGGDKIVLKKDISSKPELLKNEKIAVYMDSLSLSFFLNKFLLKNNLKFADVNPIELSDQGSAKGFVANKLKAALLCEPFAAQCVEKGDGVVISTTADFPGCMPEGLIAFDDALKAMPREDVVKILKGWLKAVNWMSDAANWPEYQKILDEKVFKDLGYKEADYKAMMTAVKIHDTRTVAERNKGNGGLADYIKEMNGFITDNKLSDKQLKPEEIIDSSFINEAVK